MLSVDTRFDPTVISFSELRLIISVFFTAAVFETADVLVVADDTFEYFPPEYDGFETKEDLFEAEDFTCIFEIEADDDEGFAEVPFPE